MSTSPPTPPATITYPLVPAASSSPQVDVRPANASTAIVNRFLSSLPAVWKFFTTVCCEILQIILLATLALVTGNLFWHSVLLDAIVIISAVGILFTGYRKLHTKDDATGIIGENESSPTENKRFPWINLKLRLTGNRLLNIVLILAFGIFKFVESIKNQTTAVTVVDFISGVVIALITTVIGYIEQDYPTVADWFFRTDYGWFILLVLKKLWGIYAYVFVALLLLPLGTTGMVDPSTYALGYGAEFIEAASELQVIIGGFLLPLPLVIAGKSVRSIILSQSTIGLKLLEKLWNVMFFWGVLWMTLLIWIRSNPEVERHLVWIYIWLQPGFLVLTFIPLEAVLSLFSFYRSRRRANS